MCNADLYGSGDAGLLGMAAMACPKDQFKAICEKVHGGSCPEKILGSIYWDALAQESTEAGKTAAEWTVAGLEGLKGFHGGVWQYDWKLGAGMDTGLILGLAGLRPRHLREGAKRLAVGGYKAAKADSGNRRQAFVDHLFPPDSVAGSRDAVSTGRSAEDPFATTSAWDERVWEAASSRQNSLAGLADSTPDSSSRRNSIADAARSVRRSLSRDTGAFSPIETKASSSRRGSAGSTRLFETRHSTARGSR
jgi:hypothetical protein